MQDWFTATIPRGKKLHILSSQLQSSFLKYESGGSFKNAGQHGRYGTHLKFVIISYLVANIFGRTEMVRSEIQNLSLGRFFLKD